MKTKQNKIQTEGLPSRPEQCTRDSSELSTDNGKCDSHPLDREQRSKNRTLPTSKVLNTLLTTLPDVYRLAEVVGKWVWVQFEETPAAEIRQQLSQLGFHSNIMRPKLGLTPFFDIYNAEVTITNSAANIQTTGQENLVVLSWVPSFQQWQVKNFGATHNPAADPDADPDGDGLP